MPNLKDEFISKLDKSHTQEVRDGKKSFKLTLGQLNGKPYVVLHEHPDMKGFGVFSSVPIQNLDRLPETTSPNLHLVKVTTVFSGIKAAKIKLQSQRFPDSKSVFLSYEDFTETKNQDIAARWMNDNGYPVVGIAEGKGCMYVLTNRFKPLVK